jgi:hypothetical protein
MALRIAVASGNWSNPAIWNGGVLPTVGDVVASNNFTVTIDQNINVDTLTNAAQAIVDAVPNMTSPTTPSGIITESATTVGFEGWQAFDGTTSLEWRPSGQQWVAYEFTAPKAIDRYYFTGDTTKNAWKFEAWDGTNWITLHSITGASVTSYTSPLLGNSTQYIKYRFFTLDFIVHRFREIDFYEYLGTSAAIAGGSFTINSAITVTCTNTTNGVAAGSVTCLTIAAVSPAVVNLNANVTSSVTSILKSGNCTLNVTGLLQGNLNAALGLNANTGTTNIVGEIRKSAGSISNAGILNTGTGNTINITGNLTYTGGLGGGNIKRVFTSSGSCIINITGNLVGTQMSASQDLLLSAGTNDIVNITGNVLGTGGFVNGTSTITGGAFYLNVVGQIVAGSGGPAINITNANAIIILTGPFVSHESGTQPLYVTRMHYRRTLGSYYEFRDNSTNGALPPAGPAPITRLVSPGTAIDAPAASNVRQGVVYAAGSLTGTMVVPAASNVANNVPVDHTLGTAVLDPNAIWAVPLTSINTLNSIGRRVKNAATVETTGAQIQTTLNNNE